MAKSIIQNEKECLVCRTTIGLHKHHVFGASNRKWSEKFGLTVYLCGFHHTGNTGVHFNRVLDQKLKKFAQERYEEVHGNNFMEVFGRNYK